LLLLWSFFLVFVDPLAALAFDFAFFFALVDLGLVFPAAFLAAVLAAVLALVFLALALDFVYALALARAFRSLVLLFMAAFFILLFAFLSFLVLVVIACSIAINGIFLLPGFLAKNLITFPRNEDASLYRAGPDFSTYLPT